MRQFCTIITVSSACFLSALALKRRDMSGTATYFYPGLGACGWQNQDSDHIVALSTELFDAGANCGEWVEITNTGNGQIACGVVVDKCKGCKTFNLDLSPSLFGSLSDGNLAQGTMAIEWDWTGGSC